MIPSPDPLTTGLERLARYGSDWIEVLAESFDSDYMKELSDFISKRLEETQPAPYNFFRHMAYCSYRDTKVVIIADEPAIQEYAADGLAFSCGASLEIPDTVSIIFKELKRDLDLKEPKFVTCFDSWAQQGVLLMNYVISTEVYKSQAHHNKGWEEFSKDVIEALNRREEPIVFLIWGKRAEITLKPLIAGHHIILDCGMPLPGLAHQGFYFSSPFTKCNKVLKSLGKPPIKWDTVDLSRFTGYFSIW